ncbi:hypothetical protein TCAL_16616 [Tigriopus californicus]|uniref:DNA polymerase n=2 Tax=Tigriopus californicus TaxID=6832 RepID=A0A553NAS7_TIGCA|nr:DNA polymerase zeta catalytic subunit-like isoform X1 [Tigriopus californicus]TRY62525.1 hypothetical protein TCAL_16616 [Tigriopus californicus]
MSSDDEGYLLRDVLWKLGRFSPEIEIPSDPCVNPPCPSSPTLVAPETMLRSNAPSKRFVLKTEPKLSESFEPPIQEGKSKREGKHGPKPNKLSDNQVLKLHDCRPVSVVLRRVDSTRSPQTSTEPFASRIQTPDEFVITESIPKLRRCSVVLERLNIKEELLPPLIDTKEEVSMDEMEVCNESESIKAETENQKDNQIDGNDLMAPSPRDNDEDLDVIESSQVVNTPPTARKRLFQKSAFEETAITSFYEYPTFMEANKTLDATHLNEIDLASSLKSAPDFNTFVPCKNAPSWKDVLESCDEFSIPHERHQKAFCSKKADVPEKGIELGQQKIRLAWQFDLREFKSNLATQSLGDMKLERLKELGLSASDLKSQGTLAQLFSSDRKLFTLEPIAKAPTCKEVNLWLKTRGLMQENPKELPKEEDENRVKDFDVDAPLPRQSQMVMRIRRDSDDSLGSEVSCSPPSSPEVENKIEVDSPNMSEMVQSSTPFTLTKTNSAISSPGRPTTTPILVHETKRRVPSPSNVRINVDEGNPISRRQLFKKRRISWDQTVLDKEDEDPDIVESSQVEERSRTPSPTPGTSCETTQNLRRRLLQSQFRNKFLTPEATLGERLGAKPDSPGSPIEGPSPNNTHNFKMSFENLQEVKALSEHQYLSVMSMEIHVNTRQKLLPDPDYDAITAIFMLTNNDVPAGSKRPKQCEEIFVLDPDFETKRQRQASDLLASSGVFRDNIRYFSSEKTLLLGLVEAVQAHDPDILCGYEVQMSSWGYVIERASRCDLNLAPSLSRVPSREKESKMNEEQDPYGADHTSELRIAGRVVLNIWRLLRSEVAFYSYTFENMMFHVLHTRVPKHHSVTLTQWWNHSTHLFRWRVCDYYLTRIHGNLNLMEQLDIIGRTSELARLFGIQFFEVISRGSQFRVESLMLRLAKRKNLIPVSPNTMQKAKMKAPEYIPLVMEPESRFYTDPLIVLDFQSLYPSIIMAYNYCYSTCLGRVQNLGSPDPIEFGCTQLKISPHRLEKLDGHLNFSPGGVAFLKPTLRKGVLPQMLKEILDTRLMVKKSMKIHKGDKTLQRVLHARQLGLKLIANVTYGYTSANFSGRMPSVEVADSVVSKGRETLERCIRFIETSTKWKAQVVYGDTDSVFVLLPGRTREEAFTIGEEIAREITQDNPKPIKLKFEKVYYPCILQTKKRYVGYMYETLDQKEPVYDAKGIETVRRDGCPAVVKILEKSLRILFETKDVSKVKLFVQRQFQKIMRNKASLQDLTFAKEFRGVSGYKPGALVPALELTRRLTRHDRRAVPRSGQRVPYVIVYGEPGRPLIQSVRSPEEVLNDSTLRPNAQYYICKVISPPLNRCLSLIGVDVLAWYLELPKSYRPRLGATNVDEPQAGTSRGQGVILQYFASHHCASCDTLTQKPICDHCLQNLQSTCLTLSNKVRAWDKAVTDIRRLCQSCTGYPDLNSDVCTSLDCPVLYKRKICQFDEEQINYVQKLMDNLAF